VQKLKLVAEFSRWGGVLAWRIMGARETGQATQAGNRASLVLKGDLK